MSDRLRTVLEEERPVEDEEARGAWALVQAEVAQKLAKMFSADQFGSTPAEIS